jgi:hypothetical protein
VKRFIDRTEDNLLLVDGGEDAEEVPFQPLLVKARGVDVIVAIDASGDTNETFADGTALIVCFFFNFFSLFFLLMFDLGNPTSSVLLFLFLFLPKSTQFSLRLRLSRHTPNLLRVLAPPRHPTRHLHPERRTSAGRLGTGDEHAYVPALVPSTATRNDVEPDVHDRHAGLAG